MNMRLPMLCLALMSRGLAAQEASVRGSQAPTRAVMAIGPGSTTYWMVEREQVDAQDPVERFLVLTADGPVVIQASITVEGKPFRTRREQLIDELLTAADVDRDGRPTWEEALSAPRFSLGRLRVANPQQRATHFKRWDKNQDGLVDRGEARWFIAHIFGAPTFMVYNGFGNRIAWGATAGSGDANVKALLDTDGDGVLSLAEMAASSARLKSRDADDNDLLDAGEINSGGAATDRPSRRFTRLQAPPQQQQQLALLLGPTAAAAPLYQALLARYQSSAGELAVGSFPAFPGLFTALDKDSDGVIRQDEVLALNAIEPHVQLEVQLGDGEGPQRVLVTMAAPELQRGSDARDQTAVKKLPNVQLSFPAPSGSARPFDYTGAAQTLLTRFDKDGNSYLEKSELPSNMVSQFELWDDDSDGKVYAKEIASSYSRLQTPQASQIRCAVSSRDNALFAALDLSGDGRLSLREMKAAPRQLAEFDSDHDSRITDSEIPSAISVEFELGNSTYQPRTVQGPLQSEDEDDSTPSWFRRMDRNGDGDLTLREFLGDKRDFDRLDANHDGFVEAAEASQAATK